MQKYLQVFHVSIQQYFVYRFSFVLWRFGTVIGIFFTYFLWTSLYTPKKVIFSYSQDQMISYILVSSIISSFVFSSRIPELAGDILSGKIINYITKPMSIISYLVSRETADKVINLIFSTAEIALLIFIFKPVVFVQTQPLAYLLVFIFVVLASVTAFFISYGLALIAFWSNEVWAPRYIYVVISTILAGTLFPLDILPKPLYELFMLTPFPYLLFIPTKIYLEGTTYDLFKPTVIVCMWILILFFATKIMWNKGMKQFSFFGK